MAKDQFVPPKCDECGKTLDTVYESEHDTYVFNPSTGGYWTEAMSGSIDIECPHCGADVRDIFEEGACNYQSTERVSSKKGKGDKSKGRSAKLGTTIIGVRS